MSKLSLKISIPIILAGLFAIAIFVALDYEKLGMSFYIVLFLLAVYVFFFGFATGQELSSPVKKLLERATELSKGNLSSRAYLETKDELAELAKVFNKIAEELERSHLQGENAEKSVDIKVRARTQALEETINALEQKIKNRTIESERLVNESEKMRTEVKSREMEVAEIKEELRKLKSRVSKTKIKNGDEDKNENTNEEIINA
jgi:two-component system sensor histidine kinase CpxA